MSSSKKKIVLISLLSFTLIIGISAFVMFSIKNVKTSNSMVDINDSNAKAFNDVKIIEEVLSKDKSISMSGSEVSETDIKFLNSLGFSEEESKKFRIYTAEDIVNSNDFSESYKQQFKGIYAGEEYYVDIENKIVILKNSRMVENTEVVANFIDDRFKDTTKKATIKENDTTKNYVAVYVRPKEENLVVTKTEEGNKIEEIGEKEENDYTGYPKFSLYKNSNLEYQIKLEKHEDMKVIEYSLGNTSNWLTYNEETGIIINQNTTIYTRYSLVENPEEKDFVNGSMKTISEVKLLQAEIEDVTKDYEGYKAAISFKFNEDDKKYIEEKLHGKLSANCMVAFVNEEREDEMPSDEEYENADGSKLVEKEGNVLKFKAEEFGSYYLKIETTVTSETNETLYVANSVQRIAKIKTENKQETPEETPTEDVPEEKEDVEIDDSELYSTDLEEFIIKSFDKEAKELEDVTLTINEEEVTLEGLLDAINNSENEVTLNVKVNNSANSIKISAKQKENIKAKIEGLAADTFFFDEEGKIAPIEITITTGVDSKTKKVIKINVEKEEKTVILDTEEIIAYSTTSSYVLGKNYLEQGKSSFDIVDKDYLEDINLSTMDLSKNDTKIYFRVSSGCKKFIIMIDDEINELDFSKAKKVEEKDLSDLKKFTGDNYDLYEISKTIKVNQNGKACDVNFIVYTYKLAEIEKENEKGTTDTKTENGSSNIDDQGSSEVKEQKQEDDYTIAVENDEEPVLNNEKKNVLLAQEKNFILAIEKGNVDVSKLEIKNVNAYAQDPNEAEVLTYGEIEKSSRKTSTDKITYVELKVTGKALGRHDIKIVSSEDKDVNFNVTFDVVPEVLVEDMELKPGEISKVIYDVEEITKKLVSFKSENNNIAKVDSKTGDITGVSVGETNVFVEVNGTIRLTKISIDEEVTVTAEDDVDESNETTAEENKEPEIITENVTLIGKGSVKVTETPNYNLGSKSKGGKKGGNVVPPKDDKVDPPEDVKKEENKTITVKASGSTSIYVGKTVQLTSNISGVTWSSSNPYVASVTTNGKVSGLKAGTATIRTSKNGYKTVETTIKVNALPSFTIEGTSVVKVGKTIQLTTTQKGVTWKSSDTKVATVSNSGIVTGKSSGTATITASYAGVTASKYIAVQKAEAECKHTSYRYTINNQWAHNKICSKCGKTVSVDEHSYSYCSSCKTNNYCKECKKCFNRNCKNGYGHVHKYTKYNSYNGVLHVAICVCGESKKENHSYKSIGMYKVTNDKKYHYNRKCACGALETKVHDKIVKEKVSGITYNKCQTCKCYISKVK